MLATDLPVLRPTQPLLEADGQSTYRWPTVSVVIPTYNEAAHIEGVVRGFLQTRYPQLIEVLVVDGGSQDGTQGIIEGLAREDGRVRLLHNPLKVQSAALNIGIATMRGAVFLRADAHSDYASNYIDECIAALLDTGTLNVGGCQRFVATTPFQAGVALAAQSALGNGGSRHRLPSYDGPSDTVFLGCCWRRDIERLERNHLRPTLLIDGEGQQRLIPSYFDLDQVTNQDSEINVRFRKLAPQAIYVSSRVKAWYYPRSSWQGLCKQFFKYGRGRYRTAALHPAMSPARVRLPLLAGLAGLLLLLLDRVAFGGRLRTAEACVLAGAVPFVEAARVTVKHRKAFEADIWRGHERARPSLVVRWWWCAVALWTMTPAFLAGYLFQLVRRRLLNVAGW